MKGRKSFHVPGARRHYMPDREFQTDHIKVEIKVDPEKKSIEGSCYLKITPLRNDLAAIHLDAVEMRVSRVQLDGAKARFDHDGERLTIRAGTPLSTTAHLVAVDYSANPTHGAYFVHPDDKYPDKPVQVWTQCEAEAARYWYPCYDHPNDKSASETVITVPEGFEVISNGRLVSQTASEGWTTYHWHESAPHSAYLNSFVVGKFVRVDDKAGRVPLQYYAPEQKQADIMRYFGQTPDMMRTFVEITGIEYPYEKYAQVAVHDFIYGGMENISATTLVDTRFPDERSEEDYSSRYSRPDKNHIELVAHELAHMWFGDLVTMRHWSHSWLNEGFATYMEALYHERRYGLDEFGQNMDFKARSYFEEDEGRYRRAIVENDYVYADDVFDACTYEKGAWMIHQLRGILGDERFFTGTREYLKRFAYGNAETNDYQAGDGGSQRGLPRALLRAVVLQGGAPRVRGRVRMGPEQKYGGGRGCSGPADRRPHPALRAPRGPGLLHCQREAGQEGHRAGAERALSLRARLGAEDSGVRPRRLGPEEAQVQEELRSPEQPAPVERGHAQQEECRGGAGLLQERGDLGDAQGGRDERPVLVREGPGD